jgi:hypothetical protein
VKTDSEFLFEQFLHKNAINFEPIPRTNQRKTPDYIVTLNGCTIAVEVTTIKSAADGDASIGYTKTIGNEIRREITDKSKQLRWAEERALPTLLLLHEDNGVGYPWFLEDHDFRDAMYGASTLQISRISSKSGPMYNGRDAQLRPSSGREHISALGRIQLNFGNNIACKIFPNIYAKRPIETIVWPSAFNLAKFELEYINVTPSLT